MIRLTAILLAISLSTHGFAADYTIDGVHSLASFKIKHLMVSTTQGRFNDISGIISYDAANPVASKVTVVLKADSIDTSNAKRDEHLKSSEFFEVAKYPTLSFTSTSWKPTGTDTYEVSGDFSLHGVTKPITITVTKSGEGKGMKGEPRIGFETAFVIKRSDYGISSYGAVVGDEVKIDFAAEAVGK